MHVIVISVPPVPEAGKTEIDGVTVKLVDDAPAKPLADKLYLPPGTVGTTKEEANVPSGLVAIVETRLPPKVSVALRLGWNPHPPIAIVAPGGPDVGATLIWALGLAVTVVVVVEMEVDVVVVVEVETEVAVTVVAEVRVTVV